MCFASDCPRVSSPCRSLYVISWSYFFYASSSFSASRALSIAVFCISVICCLLHIYPLWLDRPLGPAQATTYKTSDMCVLGPPRLKTIYFRLETLDRGDPPCSKPNSPMDPLAPKRDCDVRKTSAHSSRAQPGIVASPVISH